MTPIGIAAMKRRQSRLQMTPIQNLIGLSARDRGSPLAPASPVLIGRQTASHRENATPPYHNARIGMSHATVMLLPLTEAKVRNASYVKDTDSALLLSGNSLLPLPFHRWPTSMIPPYLASTGLARFSLRPCCATISGISLLYYAQRIRL